MAVSPREGKLVDAEVWLTKQPSPRWRLHPSLVHVVYIGHYTVSNIMSCLSLQHTP
jgi:hypothetical protein